MKKTKHSEEKIIGAVKQLESGRSVKELARELGVTDQTLYNWKSKVCVRGTTGLTGQRLGLPALGRPS